MRSNSYQTDDITSNSAYAGTAPYVGQINIPGKGNRLHGYRAPVDPKYFKPAVKLSNAENYFQQKYDEKHRLMMIVNGENKKNSSYSKNRNSNHDYSPLKPDDSSRGTPKNKYNWKGPLNESDLSILPKTTSSQAKLLHSNKEEKNFQS